VSNSVFCSIFHLHLTSTWAEVESASVWAFNKATQSGEWSSNLLALLLFSRLKDPPKKYSATSLQLSHCYDFTCISKHASWIFYVSPEGKLWHQQSNQTMATCLLTAGCKKRKSGLFCVPLKIFLKYLFLPAGFRGIFAQTCSPCEWHLHRLVREAQVKDYLQINLCVLICVQLHAGRDLLHQHN